MWGSVVLRGLIIAGSFVACVSVTTAVELNPKALVYNFGGQVHWDGAKDEEAWVLIVGEGPGTSTPVEIAK